MALHLCGSRTVYSPEGLRQNVWSSWAKHLYEDRGCTVEAVSLEAVSLEAASLEAVSLEALDAVS